MLGIGRLKRFAETLIGTRRRSAPVRALHGLASFVESAYANEGSNFNLNGERTLLRKAASANFRIAFDVGANIGDWSSEAVAVWPNVHVHAFEVAPPTFERLSENFRASKHFTRVTLNCMGLSESSDT